MISHRVFARVATSIRSISLPIAGFAALAALAGPSALAEGADPVSSDQSETVDKSYLLVLTAEAGELADGKLVLHGASDLVGWFTDRPYRETGRFELEHLAGVWSTGSDNLETDPPNAVLVAKGQEADPTIVELTDLAIDGNTVSFSAKVLEGPEASPKGSVTLIVDSIFDGCYPGNCWCNC